MQLDPKAIHHIFLSAINLVNCSLIRPPPWRVDNQLARDPFNPHRFLRKLHFIWFFSSIFSALCLPTLKELEMERHTTEDITGMLLQLYHRAPFRLEILKLSDCSFNVEEFSNFLGLVPDLKVLHLPKSRFDEGRLLKLLTTASSSSTTSDGDAHGGEEVSQTSQNTWLLPIWNT